MFNKFTLFLSLLIILFVHVTALAYLKTEDKKVVTLEQPSITRISVKKVTLKKKEIKKAEPIKKVKKIVPPKKVEKKVKKIVKKAKRKVPKKKEIKKIVKKIEKKEKKVEKVVKKMTPKVMPSVVKKIIPKITKKTIVSSVTKDVIKNEYLLRLRKKIENNKTYPKRAKRLKQQGRVLISFRISKDGEISNINLKGKSSYQRLNTAAMKLIEEIAKFEPIPKELGKNTWAIEVPINYSLVNI